MLFVINVLPYLNNGPYWNYRIGNEVDNCIQTFWYNIFGVSNQFGTDKTVRAKNNRKFLSHDYNIAMIKKSLAFFFSINRGEDYSTSTEKGGIACKNFFSSKIVFCISFTEFAPIAFSNNKTSQVHN